MGKTLQKIHAEIIIGAAEINAQLQKKQNEPKFFKVQSGDGFG
jgi:hypothetical protein